MTTASDTPTAPRHRIPGRGTPQRRTGFTDAFRFEWTKFRTTRSTVTLTAVMGAVLPALALVIAATGSLMPDDTILGASLLGGAVLAQMLAAILGALLITGEFRTGMILVTLVATPRRLVVLAAKSAVAAAVTFAVILVAASAAYGVGLLMLDRDLHATGEPFPAILGVALALASIAVLGVGIGTIVRHSAGAIGVLIGVVLLPGLLAPLLGDARRWIGGASLDGVMQKLVQSSDATVEAVGSLGAWPSLGVVAAYTIVVVLWAVRVLRHRDI